MIISMTNHLFLWLSLIAFCSINLCINVSVVSGHSLRHQRSLLLQLKRDLKFNPSNSTKLVHWNQSDDCCQWSGVTCKKGLIIALDLSEEFIYGGLETSSSLFSLQNLQNLSLAYNNFHSLIPSEFHRLKSLIFLNLSNAGFEGQIPIEISQLTSLAILDLSSSFSSHHTLKLENPNIQLLLQNLTEVQELYLDGVRILATGKEWCHAVSSVQNLRVLSMSSCNLSGTIDSSLAKLQSLSVIRLNQNNLSSPVPDFFANFSNLTTLQLTSCNISGVFPKRIFHIKALQVFDISNNPNLYGSIPDFPHLVSLNTLNLSKTNFFGYLPYSIQNLRKLSMLDLSNCQFNGTLPGSMSELSHLVLLDLSFNNFIGPLPSFNMSRKLTYLSLFHNHISGPVPFAHFDGLSNLESIDLGDNSLTGSVPSSLVTLPSLRELMLSYNRFDGLLDQFPNASSSALEILDLSGNNLQGPVPLSVFQLGRLTSLQLPLNNFNGTIQLDMIRRLRNLVTLDLSHNNLSVDATRCDEHEPLSFPKMINLLLASCKLTSFPAFLRNQSELIYLDLSSNQIHGTIPNWIWKFDSLAHLNLSNNFLTHMEGPFWNVSSNLFVLDLHSNQLQGPIPFLPRYAWYLDYSNNVFSSVPYDIGSQIPFMFFLSFSYNSLHGEIDDSFCNASALRALDLSYNNFTGVIPECLARSNNLRVLLLEGNKLSGRIPDTFSNSCALRFLDLHDNLLSGSIPKSLANCRKLQVLNLGSNILNGRFPCHLQKISSLRVLILRSNNLHGSIGCPDSLGNWEMIQIVDLASNNFVGLLPGTLLRTWTPMMTDGDKDMPKIGVHDMYDVSDPAVLMNTVSSINKDVATKLAKVFMTEPRSVVEYLFSGNNYADLHCQHLAVTVVNKGQKLTFVKILSAFTSVDFSSNYFEGPIPEELMNFKALHALNLSKNAFSGRIPPSLGNLKYLESLDLSMNSLSGEIPTELASLSFLAYLNLSVNHLVGEIPSGTQIQSFEASSFEGNKGLCGPPLTQNCKGREASETHHSEETKSSIDWHFLSAELGFIFGLGTIILPLIFLKRWRLWYCKFIEDILQSVFPQLSFEYEQHGGQKYRTLRWRHS